jgi:hypothetical protein
LVESEQAKGEEPAALVPVTWQEVDPYELNQLLLSYMREYDLIERADKDISEIQQAERLGMTRQRWDHLHLKAKTVTIPTFIHWCNARHRDADILLHELIGMLA